jgi:hypothetical protein
LHQASIYGHPAVVQTLFVERGADVPANDQVGAAGVPARTSACAPWKNK